MDSCVFPLRSPPTHHGGSLSNRLCHKRRSLQSFLTVLLLPGHQSSVLDQSKHLFIQNSWGKQNKTKMKQHNINQFNNLPELQCLCFPAHGLCLPGPLYVLSHLFTHSFSADSFASHTCLLIPKIHFLLTSLAASGSKHVSLNILQGLHARQLGFLGEEGASMTFPVRLICTPCPNSQFTLNPCPNSKLAH